MIRDDHNGYNSYVPPQKTFEQFKVSKKIVDSYKKQKNMPHIDDNSSDIPMIVKNALLTLEEVPFDMRVRLYRDLPQDIKSYTLDELLKRRHTTSTIIGSTAKRKRTTHCWRCSHSNLDSTVHKLCDKCGGIVCPNCGSCYPDC